MITHLYVQIEHENIPDGLYITKLTDTFELNKTIFKKSLQECYISEIEIEWMLDNNKFINSILDGKNNEKSECYETFYDMPCTENSFGTDMVTIWIGLLNIS